MFDIAYGSEGEVLCSGRLDAAQCEKAQSFMDEISDSRTLDFAALEYISSAGLGILLKTQKRLAESGAALKIANVNKHIYDVFRYSGFNAIFDIQEKE
ncbi:MAG: STAS domain-containing protein [Gammaproteobacteria bacterium]|nr:STAS domain-containing protein [Gammaproteobacteria bacterium]